MGGCIAGAVKPIITTDKLIGIINNAITIKVSGYFNAKIVGAIESTRVSHFDSYMGLLACSQDNIIAQGVVS